MSSQLNNDLVQRLSRLDACAVSDALDSLKISGVALGLIELAERRRIVGRAVTVKLIPDDGRASKRHLGTAAVEAAGLESVIVVDNGGRTDTAAWGGLLTLAASARGVAGVVIDGASRDIDEARELGFSIYGRAGVPRTARSRVIENAWNVPVSISGVSVAPGDFVIADGSGVVFVSQERALEVISIAETIVKKEVLMAAAVRRGVPISDVMGKTYEEMLTDLSK